MLSHWEEITKLLLWKVSKFSEAKQKGLTGFNKPFHRIPFVYIAELNCFQT
jgi:hypothetical protein